MESIAQTNTHDSRALGSHAVAGPLTTTATLLTLASSAKGWWEMMRPAGWTEDEHLACPTINCTGNREKSLARVVAEWVRLGR